MEEPLCVVDKYVPVANGYMLEYEDNMKVQEFS